MKRLYAVVAALLMTPLAVEAKVDADTPALLRTIEEYGFNVRYNPTEYCRDDIGGLIHFDDEVVALCYSGRPTANDYDTVRHEAIHLAQYCASNYRGYRSLQPIISGPRLYNWVASVLPTDKIDFIKRVYPQGMWDAEMEAFAGASAYSAAEVTDIVRQWCGR